MSHHIEIRSGAVEDIADAASWYEEKETGLGERFIREIIAAVDSLLPNPFLWRLRNVHLGARWCFPKNFPHRFRVGGDLITVVAITHAARHDRQWRKRL